VSHPSAEEDPRRKTVAREIRSRFSGQGGEINKEESVSQFGVLGRFFTRFGGRLEGYSFGEGGAEERCGNVLRVSLERGEVFTERNCWRSSWDLSIISRLITLSRKSSAFRNLGWRQASL